MCQAGGQGGQLPTQIWVDQKAPHYYLPPQIFRLCNMPDEYIQYPKKPVIFKVFDPMYCSSLLAMFFFNSVICDTTVLPNGLMK